ncbi:MarR family winged helix-turn-helix transcriptional regulator [Phenylobacterium immobile]|uniref:MarR family winged helix-turn-helix transcriptional regulator n=1 Tax=Phenylobacterium immobile TaxID=21 RepID=UPI000AE8B8CD|nr:MarR family transcriptional regulator [Phenylobacterium immobile]
MSKSPDAPALEFPPREQWMVWGLFLKAFKVVTDQVDKALKAEAPVSLPEFEILHILKNNDGRMRLIDLATGTLLSQSRISRQVDALQAKGFLVREVSEADRRATYAVLTPEGVRTYDLASQPFLRAYYKHFADLIGENAQAFGTILGPLMNQEKLPSGSSLFIDALRAGAIQAHSDARPAASPAASPSRERAEPRMPMEGFAS